MTLGRLRRGAPCIAAPPAHPLLRPYASRTPAKLPLKSLWWSCPEYTALMPTSLQAGRQAGIQNMFRLICQRHQQHQEGQHPTCCTRHAPGGGKEAAVCPWAPHQLALAAIHSRAAVPGCRHLGERDVNKCEGRHPRQARRLLPHPGHRVGSHTPPAAAVAAVVFFLVEQSSRAGVSAAGKHTSQASLLLPQRCLPGQPCRASLSPALRLRAAAAVARVEHPDAGSHCCALPRLQHVQPIVACPA